MLAEVGSVALVGLDARPVRVQCSSSGGLPGVRVVGMPDTAVREAGERVLSAVKRSEGCTALDGKVVLNLAPAALRKTGGGFDLPMALAALGATEQLPAGALRGVYAFGELGLDGSTRDVPGVLPVASAVRGFGARRLLVPQRSAVEASLVEGLDVVPVADLAEAAAVLRGDRAPARPAPIVTPEDPPVADLADVRGQAVARRALEVAAAGGHHLLLVGPPGCGKSMLAHRMPGVLPRLDVGAALEVAAIHSVAGHRAPDAPLSTVPPVLEPHHSTSAAGLIGGGAGVPRPGAASLAHHGVLFLDELLEIPRPTLDALREPLEAGRITLTRSLATVRYPARFLLVGATNPCPCGHLGSPRRCRCRPDQVARYRARLSGPLLDRIDLQVEMRPVERERLAGPADGEATARVAGRVAAARAAAADRWGAGATVAAAPIAGIRATCPRPVLGRLSRAIEQLGLSARAFDRALRVARTIGDLAGDPRVSADHVDEAVAYRLPDLAGAA